MSGFIALHREAFDHPLLRDGDRFRAWFWLVANAAWKATRHDARGKTIIVERGQICAGRDHLAKVWGWSPSAVERFLTRLETEHMIERQTGQGKSVITVCNYDKYQDAPDETGHKTGQQTGQTSDRHRTAKEQGNKETRLEEETSVSPSSASGCNEQAGESEQEAAPAKPKRSAAKGRPAKPLPVVPLPDWMPLDAWSGFLEMRVAKGSPPPERALIALIRKLDEFRHRGHDPTAVLDQSTIARWSDVYELKDGRNGSAHFSGSSIAQQQSGAPRSPAAGFERRAAAARARELAGETDGRADGPARGDRQDAASRPLPLLGS